MEIISNAFSWWDRKIESLRQAEQRLSEDSESGCRLLSSAVLVRTSLESEAEPNINVVTDVDVKLSTTPTVLCSTVTGVSDAKSRNERHFRIGLNEALAHFSLHGRGGGVGVGEYWNLSIYFELIEISICYHYHT